MKNFEEFKNELEKRVARLDACIGKDFVNRENRAEMREYIYLIQCLMDRAREENIINEACHIVAREAYGRIDIRIIRNHDRSEVSNIYALESRVIDAVTCKAIS